MIVTPKRWKKAFKIKEKPKRNRIKQITKRKDH